MESIADQLDFLRRPISRETQTVHRWRRNHIADLLNAYLKDMKFKQQLLVDKSVIEQLAAHLEGEKEEIRKSAETYETNMKDWREKAEELGNQAELILTLII